MSDRTILNPANANALNGVFNGAGTSNIYAKTFTTTVGGTSTFDAVNIAGVLNCDTTITADGGITAPTFTTSAGGTSTFNAVLMTGDCTCNSSITSTEFILDGNGSTNNPTITTNAGNNFVVSTASNSGLTISSTSGNATFTPGASGVSVNNGITASTFTTSVGGTSTFDAVNIVGTLTCPTYSGGIGMVVLTGLNPGSILTGNGYTFTSVEIPNFVGSASSAFVITNNTPQATLPIFYPLTFNVNFVSTSGTSTFVDLTVVNAGSISYSPILTLSIIAMN